MIYIVIYLVFIAVGVYLLLSGITHDKGAQLFWGAVILMLSEIIYFSSTQ